MPPSWSFLRRSTSTKSVDVTSSRDKYHWRTSEGDTDAGLDFGDGNAACHGVSEGGFGAAITGEEKSESGYVCNFKLDSMASLK